MNIAIDRVEQANPKDFWRWAQIALERHLNNQVAMGMDKEAAQKDWRAYLFGGEGGAVRQGITSWHDNVMERVKNVPHKHRR